MFFGLLVSFSGCNARYVMFIRFLWTLHESFAFWIYFNSDMLKNLMLRNENVHRMSSTISVIDWNTFLYGGHLENPIWLSSDAFLNSTVVFLTTKTCLDIKISIVCHIEAEILTEICFLWRPSWKSNMAAVYCFSKWHSCILLPRKHMLKNQTYA